MTAISQDYAIVDDDPMTVRGYYATIGAAVASGASTIEVRDGVYPESVTLDRPMTLLCREGASLTNDGASVSVRITADAIMWISGEVGTKVALGLVALGTSPETYAIMVSE